METGKARRNRQKRLDFIAKNKAWKQNYTSWICSKN